MKVDRILYQLGFDKCIVRTIQQVDKRIVSDANFNIESYIKERISYGIGKEIAKRDDIVESDLNTDTFINSYRAEVFVFTREELEQLINKLTETR